MPMLYNDSARQDVLPSGSELIIVCDPPDVFVYSVMKKGLLTLSS